MPNNKTESVITIAKIGEKDNKFWIKDQSGEFYSGFKEYQGTQNTEYAQLMLGNHGEPFKEGDNALVVFTKTVGKDDKIYKNIRGIYPADGPNASEGTKTAPQPQSTPQRANIASSGARDYDKEAVGKCQYGFLEAYIRSGHSFQEAKLQVVVARKLAELVVYGTQQANEIVDTAADEPRFTDDEFADIPF